MFKFRSNSGQKCSPEPEPEPEQKCCSGTGTGTGTGIPVDLWYRCKTAIMHASIALALYKILVCCHMAFSKKNYSTHSTHSTPLTYSKYSSRS